MKPNFFIAGCHKSGTTSMWHYLKGHREIHMAADKEPGYYSEDYRGKHFNYTPESYYALFDCSNGVKIRGDASTQYFYSDVAPDLIKKDVGAVKILLMLRNPVEVIHADHSTRLDSGAEDIKDFKIALEKGGKKESSTHKLPGYKEGVRYGTLVERWIKTFGRENVKVVIFEDFKKDNGGVFREILGFLGVDEDFVPEFEVKNPNTVIRSPIVQKADRFAKSLPQGVKNIVKVFLPLKARNAIGAWNLKKVEREPLEEELRSELMEELMPEIKKLEGILGRELEVWYGS